MACGAAIKTTMGRGAMAAGLMMSGWIITANNK